MHPIDLALHELLLKTGSENPSEHAIRLVKSAFLDCLACLAGGLASPAATAVRAYVDELGSAPRAHVFGSGLRAAPALAALANGTAAHALEYDDMNSLLIGHPSVVLVPVVMALGEDRHASGREAIGAYLQGFEVDAWFGRLMNPRHFRDGWHPTSTIGVLGAAAAAARMLGLDARKAASAIGVAASQASGIQGNFGAMTKSLHAGHAAERGILSAALVAKGFTSSPEAFTAANGYLKIYGTNGNADAKVNDPRAAAANEILDSALGFKPYPVGGAGISPIDAALDLQAAHNIPVENISSITLEITPLAGQVRAIDRPRNIGEGKLSMQFCVAIALVDRKAGVAQFTAERFGDPMVQRLVRMVEVRKTDTLVSTRGIFPSVLTVKLTDGRTVVQRVEAARGHPDRPLSAQDLETKFMDCATPVLGPHRASRVVSLVDRLDTLEDMYELSAAIAGRDA